MFEVLIELLMMIAAFYSIIYLWIVLADLFVILNAPNEPEFTPVLPKGIMNVDLSRFN